MASFLLRLQGARAALATGRDNAIVAYLLDVPEADIDRIALPATVISNPRRSQALKSATNTPVAP